MKKRYRTFIYGLTFLMLASCTSDQEIIRLLKSKKPGEIIPGAYKAGETGDKKFVPLLLENADDMGMTTNFQFKGVSIFQAKMDALRKIYRKDPPVPITYRPDSVIIRFYMKLSLEK